MADLIKHHGSSHRRVEHVVRQRSQEPVWSKDCRADLPNDPARYSSWFAAGAGELVTTLRAADPDAPLWTNGTDQHARYWVRRILGEAVVHRADAELALARVPAIRARVAVEGIDEFLTNVPGFPWVAERLRELGRDGQTLHFHANDHDGEWMLTLRRPGFTWVRGHGTATVTAEGAAGDLLLVIYGRLPVAGDRFAVTGDDQLLTDWLAKCAL